jgi:protocatechuate 3,4-dioxygenase beta subunit
MTRKPVQGRATGWTRRRLLAAGLAVGASMTPLLARAGLTPAQAEGPFYPSESPADSDADLTRIDGRSERAEGQSLMVSGRVLDPDGNPVAGARVDIWQANHFGRYRHAGDRSEAPLDPNFQGFGQVTTGADGRYRFLTIKPGAYAASRSWQRPPHIHFKVRGAGVEDLTTQMYFAGNPLNGGDRILQALSATEQRRVVVPFAPGPDGIPAGRFDIRLRIRA